MEDFGEKREGLVAEQVDCVVEQDTGPLKVVLSMLNRRMDNKFRLDYGSDYTVMVEAADPKSCSQGLLSGH